MTIETSISLFGALRDYHPQSTVNVNLPDGQITAADLKRILETELEGNDRLTSLLSRCRVATDTAILLDDETIDPAAPLAVLPPVNGG